MEKTVTELEQMGANLLSTALVPVGLTRHRQGLPQLKKFTPAQAKSIIKKVHELQNLFLRTRGSRFVFLADEFYNLAGLSLPGHEEYENYPQLENGVGLARQFLNELETVAGQVRKIKKLPAKLSITLVSGLAARPQLNKLVERLKGIENLAVSMIFVKNLFFGGQVTVSGLLTGGDLLVALKGKNLGDVVFIPKVMLNENNALLLDDLTLLDLERALKVPVRTVSGPAELMGRLLETADNRKID